jgi:hypothetical protein
MSEAPSRNADLHTRDGVLHLRRCNGGRLGHYEDRMRKGKIVEVDQKEWRKVLRAPKIIAAVGYWGFIGKIIVGGDDEQRFREEECLTN